MIHEPNPIEFYRGKKVCVPGATGMVGSYVVRALQASGAYVRGIWHERMTNAAVADAPMKCNLMLPDDARAAVEGCDVVINCAGVTGGIGLAHSNPLDYVGPATAMAINVLHAAALAKVARFGYLSSTTVYPPSDSPVKEGFEDTGPPYKLYAGIGESKRYLEKLHRYYHDKTGMAVAVVRPAGIYGRWDSVDAATSHVVPGMITRALELKDGDLFEVWGDGGDVRDFVHAQDAARGILLATAQVEDADPINIASGSGTTTEYLARLVLKAAGSSATIQTRPDKPTAMRTRLVNVVKAKERLGWVPEVALADGVADVVAWMRETR